MACQDFASLNDIHDPLDLYASSLSELDDVKLSLPTNRNNFEIFGTASSFDQQQHQYDQQHQQQVPQQQIKQEYYQQQSQQEPMAPWNFNFSASKSTQGMMFTDNTENTVEEGMTVNDELMTVVERMQNAMATPQQVGPRMASSMDALLEPVGDEIDSIFDDWFLLS